MPLRQPDIQDEQNRDNLEGLDLAIKSNQAAARKRLTALEGTYKTLYQMAGAIETDATANTYFLNGRSSNIGSGGSFSAGTIGAPIFYLTAADYAVSGKTAKIRIRACLAANATAPGITFTVGLHPVTVAGGADAMVFTAGTVVASSTVVIATPSASTITNGTASADISLPSDGAYMLAAVTSGTLANNSAVVISAQIQMRHT